MPGDLVSERKSEKRTKKPCVGICSCTLGDPVCRGCGLTDEEVRDWNGYTEQQKLDALSSICEGCRTGEKTIDVKAYEHGKKPVTLKCHPVTSGRPREVYVCKRSPR